MPRSGELMYILTVQIINQYLEVVNLLSISYKCRGVKCLSCFYGCYIYNVEVIYKVAWQKRGNLVVLEIIQDHIQNETLLLCIQFSIYLPPHG